MLGRKIKQTGECRLMPGGQRSPLWGGEISVESWTSCNLIHKDEEQHFGKKGERERKPAGPPVILNTSSLLVAFIPHHSPAYRAHLCLLFTRPSPNINFKWGQGPRTSMPVSLMLRTVSSHTKTMLTRCLLTVQQLLRSVTVTTP